MNAGVMGVTCAPPNQMLFAEGLNGDEDLKETIEMKGEKFRFSQELSQQVPKFNRNRVIMKYKDLPYCTGTNGPTDVNCKPATCDGANGPMDGPVGTPCNRPEDAKITPYEKDPTQGRPYETTGDLTRPYEKSSTFPAQTSQPYPTNSIAYGQLVQLNGNDLSAPEKIIDLSDTPKSTYRTTYM